MFLFAAAVFFLTAVPCVKCLSVSSRQNPSERFLSRAALNGFIISYTHSVNKGRIRDYYTCAPDGQLIVDRTAFVSYGAGIPELADNAGSDFTVTDNGYEISGLNRKIPRLLMAVGVIAEHSVTVSGREMFLKDFFAPQTSLVFEIKKLPVFEYMFERRI